jgi:hypothetical protein
MIMSSMQVFAQGEDKITVMIDCRGCDDNFMRQNTLFLTHVRDQGLAEVYLLVNRSGNASSEIYNLEFEGKGRFEGIDNEFTVDYSRTLTDNEIRDRLLGAIINGFIPYLMHTDKAKDISSIVELSTEEIEATQSTDSVVDPWKFWVFEVRGNLRLREQDQRQELNYFVGIEGDKVTEDWRIRIDGFYDSNVLTVTEPGEPDFTAVRDRQFFRASVVRSVGNHWSAGVFATADANTVENYALRTEFTPAIEYSLFDYQEVLTKEITFAYQIGYVRQKYIETTIFDSNLDIFPTQTLSANVRFRQNWGSIFSSLNASNFLNDFSKNRIRFNANVSVRIFQGFNVRFDGNFAIIRDQINLQKGEASLEDIILQQRAIATGYQLGMGIGVSYTFGSIYNNILNTRL